MISCSGDCVCYQVNVRGRDCARCESVASILLVCGVGVSFRDHLGKDGANAGHSFVRPWTAATTREVAHLFMRQDLQHLAVHPV